MNEIMAKNAIQWDDLRYFLALYRHKKLVTAGKFLNVNHTTVGRRVRELEAILDAQLFEKKETGFEITQSGQKLLICAKNMESEILGIKEKVACPDNGMVGVVHLLSPESFSNAFLALKLPLLLGQYKNLKIDFLTENKNDSFNSRRADIVITTQRPSEGRFVVRRLLDYKVGLFAAKSYLQGKPTIGNTDDICLHNIIGGFEKDVADNKEFYKKISITENNMLFKNCNIATQYKLLKEGGGLCFLPDFMVENGDDIVQILPNSIGFVGTFWLVVNEDVRYVARIKKVADFIADVAYQCRNGFLTSL